jgi:hypothetical protein
MPRGKRTYGASAAAVQAAAGHAAPRAGSVESILLTLIEPGRAPTVRGNQAGESGTTAVAEPTVRLNLNWTGSQPSGRGQLPDATSLIFITLDPTACFWIYDYNNRGAAGAAQTSKYTWQVIGVDNVIGTLFAAPAFTTTQHRPLRAQQASDSEWAPHDQYLLARHGRGGSKFYMLLNAPKGNTDINVSQIAVLMKASDNSTWQAGDIIFTTLYDGNDENEFAVSTFGTTIVDPANDILINIAIPRTSFYRIETAWQPVTSKTAFLFLSIESIEACAMMTVHTLPEYDMFSQAVTRIRVLGSAMDVINQINKSSRGGSVVVTQFGSSYPMLSALQEGLNPVDWVGATRRVEPRDFAEGCYAYCKPQGEHYLDFSQPYMLKTTNTANPIEGSRCPMMLPQGFVVFALSCPDIVSGVGANALTITSRGQVTLDYRAAIEFDSESEWFAFRRSMATDQEWELALEAIVDLEQ